MAFNKICPWAAYIQDADGRHSCMEQDELKEEQVRHSIDNPDQIDLEAAIAAAEEVHIDH